MENEKIDYMTPDKVISGSQGMVWVTYNDTNERFAFARLISLEAKAKLNKSKVGKGT